MASGIKVDQDVIDMWNFFHKNSFPPGTAPEQETKLRSHMQKKAEREKVFQEEKDNDSSDTDSDSDCEDDEPKKLRPRVMAMCVSPDCKTIKLEKKKFNIPMKKKDGVADTDRCAQKLIRRLTQGSTASCKKPRWIVVYFDFLTEVDNRPTGKTIMIKWCPDSSSIKQKMYLSSSTKGLTDVLTDFKATAVQCDSAGDIHEIIANLKKGTLK